jgi:HAT1-interacting factor 1
LLSQDDEEGDGEEEEEDDFDIAFQTLDLARVLFTKKLEAEQQNPDTEDSKGKEVSEGDSPAVKHIKERLADAHDLLAEISLENEKYLETTVS